MNDSVNKTREREMNQVGELSEEELETIAGGPIYVQIPTVPGDVKTESTSARSYFIADSFSFAVERDMKE